MADEVGVECLRGTYARGTDKAHHNIGSAKKRAEHTDVFGCPMVGTFNVELTPGTKIKSKPFLRHGADSYWLVRLRRLSPAREAYAYAVRWEGSKMPDDRMELLSKCPIPGIFKEGPIDVTVYEKWSPERIEAWQDALDDKTKWQGHKFWQPQRADSAFVWNRMQAGHDFNGKTVLDIGCNAGYFSFRAAQRGAVVTGVEKNKDILGVARTIQEHIEMTDVEFAHMGYPEFCLLTQGYDYIFYLSVHHQRDPGYEKLGSALRDLKRQAGRLFVELINPPLSGSLSEQAVNTVMAERGYCLLAHYRHGVRGERSLYVF